MIGEGMKGSERIGHEMRGDERRGEERRGEDMRGEERRGGARVFREFTDSEISLQLVFRF